MTLNNNAMTSETTAPEESFSVVPVDQTLSARDAMTPKEIMDELSKHIIGQEEAKRAIAIALRNRWRRMQLPPELQDEIVPKNMLMIGYTGVGKTEIARRVAKLTDSPFIKVDATQFTEVGYVGRDVDSIIRDLVDISFKHLRQEAIALLKPQAKKIAEDRILDILVPPARSSGVSSEAMSDEEGVNSKAAATRRMFLERLRSGEMDEQEIEIEVAALPVGMEIMGPPGMEDMTNQLQGILQNINASRTRTRRMKIKDAFKHICEEEAVKLLNEEELKSQAIEAVEQRGMVFIDEIDKVCCHGAVSGADISREGVQRDFLPLIEGSTVSTKYGMVRTDYILFIAAGAFYLSKPSDLIPELQGRLPIRVELKALTARDFERILTEPKASLTTQYQALLSAENVKLEFTDDSIKRIAEIACLVNEKTENIGARRLHTVMERLLEKISFEASNSDFQMVTIDTDYVNEQLAGLAKDEDLSHYIL